jgi:hypothetical protein
MRVLFADDQIPSPSDAENERCREELRKELSGKLQNFDAAYQEDFAWFAELVRHLSVDMGFKLIAVKSFARAKEQAQRRDEYDVAVIDLSWTGDPGLAPQDKRNAGLEILRLIAEGNRSTRKYKPTIAFSQNYSKDPELFAQVLETGALPISKDYTSTGHRSLAAAIKLMGVQLASIASSSPQTAREVTIGTLIKGLTVAELWGIAAAILTAFAAVATFAYWLGTRLGAA